MKNKLYVGNLPYSVTRDDLTDFFSQYGTVTSTNVVEDRETGRSKGFAFVEFETEQSAEAALAANDVEMGGRKMRVNLARENTGGSRGRSGGGGQRFGGGSRQGGGRPGGRSSGNHDRDRY